MREVPTLRVVRPWRHVEGFVRNVRLTKDGLPLVVLWQEIWPRTAFQVDAGLCGRCGRVARGRVLALGRSGGVKEGGLVANPEIL